MLGMNILLKYPTRGRPQLFLQTLQGWLSRAAAPTELRVLVSYDVDDAIMTDEVVAAAKALHPAVTAVRGASKPKIEACNADLPTYAEPWDVVLLVSDDMFCCRDGWDDVIREHMSQRFPDTDGALWFHDGRQRRGNTLECVGRKRYEHFGYLYHPSYVSFFCDDESTTVGLRDSKLHFVEPGICMHEHPSMGGQLRVDATYLRNNPWMWRDYKTFVARKAQGFPVR